MIINFLCTISTYTWKECSGSQFSSWLLWPYEIDLHNVYHGKHIRSLYQLYKKKFISEISCKEPNKIVSRFTQVKMLWLSTVIQSLWVHLHNTALWGPEKANPVFHFQSYHVCVNYKNANLRKWCVYCMCADTLHFFTKWHCQQLAWNS